MALAFAMSAMLSGCGMKYTRHASQELQGKKIESKRFLILPLASIEHQPPPSSCLGSQQNSDASEYREQWQAQVAKSLQSRFRNHSFRSFNETEMLDAGLDPMLLESRAAQEIKEMGARQISIAERSEILYVPMRERGSLQRELSTLREKTGADYVIMLVEPRLSGEIVHSYNAQGGMTSQTYYTGDVKFGIWSTETGLPVYASGTWNKSSGFCLFQNPIQGAIGGSSKTIRHQLQDIISSLLRQESDKLAAHPAAKQPVHSAFAPR